MNDAFVAFLYVVFCLVTIFFVYHLFTELSNKHDKKVSFNEVIDTKPIPGRKSVQSCLSHTQPAAIDKSAKIKTQLDHHFKQAAPLQSYDHRNVDDSPPDYDYENRYLETDLRKDTMKGYSDNSSNSNSTFETIPMTENPDFFDATGLAVKDTSNYDEADFKPDMELTYTDWFQGKTPRVYVPPDSITNPKFERKLNNKQEFTALGEWTYQNETELSTGKTGNNITGYSSFHNSAGSYNNKLEVSTCSK